MPKKGGKKGKKGPALVTDAASLAPFNVNVRDIIATPLGVETTVVGVKDGALMVMWPGGLVTAATCAPSKAHNAQELSVFGYNKRPASAHIERSINEREQALYEHRRYDKPLPLTARINLPLGKKGVARGKTGLDGTDKYEAFQAYLRDPLAPRAGSAPAGKDAKKKK